VDIGRGRVEGGRRRRRRRERIRSAGGILKKGVRPPAKAKEKAARDEGEGVFGKETE